jgi:energy-coupling factor transporter ATP-binding protein EcfA2
MGNPGLSPSQSTILNRPLLFVQGKGGVGKSTVALATARLLSETHRTLLISIEDPLRPPYEVQKLSPTLDHLNNEATAAFEEYAGRKIGAPHLVKIFLQNRFMRYVAKAAPGIRELVLIGKIWYETRNYARVVVDMPATGHGLTLFQSLFNWGSLFAGSPLAKDSAAMVATLSDPTIVGHLIVSLPEEMPLVEALELRTQVRRIFANADCALAVNRRFPAPTTKVVFPEDRPFAATAEEHAARKSGLEADNLEFWRGEKYFEVPFFPPPREDAFKAIAAQVAETFRPLLRAGGSA